jgi:hypothetical protein
VKRPDVPRVLARTGEFAIDTKVRSINCLGLFVFARFQQKRAQGMPGWLRPGPGLFGSGQDLVVKRPFL